ncbi:cAMP-dependent protein kinase inhibitor alpha-like isoform X1 [Petromyzon marinus]|uniref:cAMP-dependent protein kinase inhibitor alpha-like isoform X1 n=1 Tax=Petromyzon marinus TaxID=7757 RepID=UPI003F731045
MTDVEPASLSDFAASGRSGRRNALPDILGSPSGTSSGELPLKLAELTVTAEGASQEAQTPTLEDPVVGNDGNGGDKE